MTPLRIAMWSGPRNISTALMRAWENRGDCAVSDEPLYAAYLAETGLDHPGRDEIVAQGETDWKRVVAHLTGPVPGDKPIWYQKHMTHHLLPSMQREWVHALTNVLLIREPEAVVASYLKSRSSVTPQDIGLPQQAMLFDELSERGGKAPIVIDADVFLRSPRTQLQRLCQALGVPFSDRMLHWPAGTRASDGIWAPYWYEAVWRSTGFEPWAARKVHLEGDALRVAQACRSAYQRLRAFALA
jgi:Sulfotransferase domain